MNVTDVKISKRRSVMGKKLTKAWIVFLIFLVKLCHRQNGEILFSWQKRNKEFLRETAYLEIQYNTCSVIQILGKTPQSWQTSNSCAFIPWKGFILISYSCAYDRRDVLQMHLTWNNNICEKLKILGLAYLLLVIKKNDF